MPNVSGRRAVVSKHHASTMSGKRKHALLLDMSQNFVVAPLGRVVFASLAREFVRKKTSATLSPARVHDIDATIGVLLARAFIVSSPLSSNHIRSPRLPAACQPTEPTPATPTGHFSAKSIASGGGTGGGVEAFEWQFIAAAVIIGLQVQCIGEFRRPSRHRWMALLVVDGIFVI
jgi:hypothetical protein